MINEFELTKARQRCHAGYVLDWIIRDAQYVSHTWDKIEERRTRLSGYFFLLLEALDLAPLAREGVKFKRALGIDEASLLEERKMLKHNMTSWWER